MEIVGFTSEGVSFVHPVHNRKAKLVSSRRERVGERG